MLFDIGWFSEGFEDLSLCHTNKWTLGLIGLLLLLQPKTPGKSVYLQGKIIKSMNNVQTTGYLAPLTQSGKIMSNNITASCCQYFIYLLYTKGWQRIFSDASIPHAWSEIGFLPVKMFPELLLDNQESQSVEGTRTYVRFIKWFGR